MNRERQVTFFSDFETIDRDSDTKTFQITEAVGFELRLTENGQQCFSDNIVPCLGSRFEITATFDIPILLLGGLKFPPLLCLPQKLCVR